MKKYTSEQSGRSMIEMLGVLAIVGVLSVAGIAGYSKAMAKYKVNKLVDQVSTVAANVRTTFAGQGNYKGLDSETAYSLGIYPEELVKDCDINKEINIEGCLKNAFGGGVSVSSDVNDVDYNFFDVAGDDRDLYSLSELKTSSTAIAAEICNCSDSKNICTVGWRFK